MALKDYVDRFVPEFTIGAMDQNNTVTFGQWGPRRLLVPQLFLIDKTGLIQGQFMGSDTMFEGDKVGNLRAAVSHLINPPKSTTPVAKKK